MKLLILCLFYSHNIFAKNEEINPYVHFHECFLENRSHLKNCFKEKYNVNFTLTEIQKLNNYFFNAKVEYSNTCPSEILKLIPKYKTDQYNIWCGLLSQKTDIYNIVFYEEKVTRIESMRKLHDLRFIPK